MAIFSFHGACHSVRPWQCGIAISTWYVNIVIVTKRTVLVGDKVTDWRAAAGQGPETRRPAGPAATGGWASLPSV